ncbi:MAG: flagellar biosynthesis anti-sigma factor FlgM [Spirochaetaceae bacterium]|jgi:negative regulator of flagellin synthesis FlgM|nr:flagellar biosynthesis anti-sigma factor FlgM [Spirochaetaceae bacterium]
MKIQGLNGVEQVQNPKKSAGVEKSAGNASSEPTVNISKTAANREDFLRALEIVKAANTPDIRADRVAELKAKINDPAYINESLIKLTADRVVDLLLG